MVHSQRKGTKDDPFAHITDALTKAREYAAPYSNSIPVTIFLASG